MWEKFKNSKLATKMKEAKSSRAVYVTTVTLLLAVAVLITATAIANRVKKQNGKVDLPPVDQAGNNDQTGDNAQGDQAGESTPPPSTDAGNTNGPTEDEGNATPTATVPELSLPVSGSISKGHDASIQVFSPTTGDYRIHLGVDMITAEDAPVLAAADGVVSRIWDDALMGKCLAISHSGDCYTIYKNLAKTLPEGIAEGASVRSGQLIASVGESAMVEVAEEPHLHFEMTVSDLGVDPLEYFDENALASLGIDASHGE